MPKLSLNSTESDEFLETLESWLAKPRLYYSSSILVRLGAKHLSSTRLFRRY